MTELKKLKHFSLTGTLQELAEFLSPPPLIPGEDPYEFNQIFDRALLIAKPKDAIEVILLRDVFDLNWEVLRWRRLKAKLISSSSSLGLDGAIGGLCSESDVDELVNGWDERDPEVLQRIDSLLEQAGRDRETIMAHTLTELMDQINWFEGLIETAESRRNMAIREIDRHREALGRQVREAVSEIEDLDVDAPIPEYNRFVKIHGAD